MKFKVKKAKGTAGRALVAKSGRNEAIDYVEAERLRQGKQVSFVPFSCEKKARDFVMTYDLGMAVSLKEMAKTPGKPASLPAFLLSVKRLLEECEENNLTRQHALLDWEYVFYNHEDQAFRYIYLPVQGLAPIGSLTSILLAACEKIPACDADNALRAAVVDYARSTPLITRVSFEGFLASQDFGTYIDDDAERVDPMAETLQLGSERRRRIDDETTNIRKPEVVESTSDYWLRCVETGQTFLLVEGVYLVGRKPGCEVGEESDFSLSREHARLTVDASGCRICDLKSTNGVVVNGLYIIPEVETPLVRGDKLSMGRLSYELR